MTTAHRPREPRVEVLPPEEALRRAHKLPSRKRLAVEDVPAADWDKLREALTEA
jgi:hypothetical protein